MKIGKRSNALREDHSERAPKISSAASAQGLIEGRVIDACESVIWQARTHRIHLLWPSIAGMFFGLIAVLLFIGAMSPNGSFGGTGILAVGALLFLVTALLVAGIPFVNWQSRKVMLTDKRLRLIQGLLVERPADIFLNTIESVVVQQGIVGRMLGFGTVILRDRDGIVLKKIAQPTKCLWKLQELLRQGREHGC